MVQLPAGSHFVHALDGSNAAEENSALWSFYQVGGAGSLTRQVEVELLAQILQDQFFDQLRTKEQLGYAVFSGTRNSSTTVGFRFIIQSEKNPRFLETRIEAFLVSFTDTLANMSNADFESHKRSLIVKRLEKLKNLDQETGRHWNQINNEYYEFDHAQQDAAEVRALTKADLIGFYDYFIHPRSPVRAKLSLHLVAQARSDVSTGQISELVKTLNLEGETARQAATDLQARLTAAHHDEKQEEEGMRTYLLKDLQVAEDKTDAAVEAWKMLSKEHKTNGVVAAAGEKEVPSLNGTEPVLIEDVHDFKSGLAATAGARPARDLSEFEDLDSKL